MIERQIELMVDFSGEVPSVRHRRANGRLAFRSEHWSEPVIFRPAFLGVNRIIHTSIGRQLDGGVTVIIDTARVDAET